MKKAKFLCLTAATILSAVTLASCGGGSSKVTVTFYDGDTVLKTEKIDKGSKVSSYVPVKDDFVFTDWYATPNYVHPFDFDAPITQDTKVFGLFSKANQSVDTRDFYIVGSGTSEILRKSNWGKLFDDTTKMTKAADKNEYTYTVNLNVGDEFQFAINDKWHNQKGYGYLATNLLADGTEAFTSSQTIGDNASLRINIKVITPGNYTFVLNTHPDDDTYETSNPQFKEENKEAFNINYNDRITWTRNGDVTEEKVETVKEFFIKGASITNWKNMFNNATQLVEKDGVATLEVYLKQGDEFLIISRFTTGTEDPVEGNIYVKHNQLDDATKELFDAQQNGNIIVKTTGTYTLSYNVKDNKLSATLDETKSPVAADYYIDGTFGEGKWDGYCFSDAYKLQAGKSGKYTISNVQMKKDSEFIIQAFKEGATERGEWGTDTYTGLGSYNYTYFAEPGEAFVPVSATNKNIKVLEEGAYDITLDSYAKIITVTKHTESKDTLDIYIKGSGINEWKHNFSEEYCMKLNAEETKYEYTLTVGDTPVEFGLEVHPDGEKTGYGTFVNTSKLGTEGDANSLFGTEGNFKCSTKGTYKIVYDIATEKVDIFKA